MLSVYAYSFVSLMRQLRELERILGNAIGGDPGAQSSPPEPTNPIGLLVRMAASLATELGLQSTELQTKRLTAWMASRKLLSDLLPEMRQLGVRIEEDLRFRHFLFVPPELVPYWD